MCGRTATRPATPSCWPTPTTPCGPRRASRRSSSTRRDREGNHAAIRPRGLPSSVPGPIRGRSWQGTGQPPRDRAAAERPPGPAVSVVRGLVRSARPKQWLKNVLVFAAPGAAGVLDELPALGRTVLAFVAFCLAASGIYLWNDALDVESDRLHPTKRHRPIAAGVVPVRTAQVVGTILPVAGLGVAALTGQWQTVVVVALYVAVVMLYSAWLKHVAVLDIVTVASGFVLRAAGGATAVDVEMSDWFVLVTVFGSLFIVTGKRYAELREIGEDAAAVRPTLASYSLGYLRIVLAVSCGAAL